MFRTTFLSAAADAGIHTAYYALCHAHPLRLDQPSISTSARNVLGAVTDGVQLEKLRGPGSVYRILALPEGVALNVIIQGRDIIETHFRVVCAEYAEEGSFAILSRELMLFTATASTMPPYPRPAFYSMAELFDILQAFDHLTRELGRVASQCSG